MGAARRVFLSHTSELRRYPTEQKSFISAAEDAVTRAGDVVADMAYFTAQDAATAEASRQGVLAADIYVLIAGFHYGSLVADRPVVSHTELEFEIAKEAGKQRFAFLLSEMADGPRDLHRDNNSDRQDTFRQRVRDELTVVEFANPDQLTTFLFQALTAPAVQSVSPPPEQPDDGTATTLPALAGPAQQRLQDLLTLLQRTTRILEQVEHSGAKPAGMDDWDSFADQDRKHEQLAAALRDPAEDLKVRSEQVFQTAKDAGQYVRQLGAEHFAKRAARLAPIVRTVTELEAISRELAGSMAAMRDEIKDRAEDYPGYRAPRDALRDAYEFIDGARENVTWMRQALDRLRQILEAGNSSAAGPAGPRPSQRTGRGSARETGSVPVPIVGKAAANPTGSLNAQHDDEQLWIPEDYGRRDGVYAVLVDGDSMTVGRDSQSMDGVSPADSIDEGDYVIVDPSQQPADGDIAVVRMGGHEDTDQLVKRVRLQADGSKLRSLESSNPKYPPIRGRALAGAFVEGKVIGVFRPVK